MPSTSADDYFGYGGLAVDAQNPDTIMVAALNSWWPDTMIFRSTNGGATWTRIWDFGGIAPIGRYRYVQDISASPWLTFGANPQPPEVTPKLGWMVGDLEIDPFNSNRHDVRHRRNHLRLRQPDRLGHGRADPHQR